MNPGIQENHEFSWSHVQTQAEADARRKRKKEPKPAPFRETASRQEFVSPQKAARRALEAKLAARTPEEVERDRKAARRRYKERLKVRRAENRVREIEASFNAGSYTLKLSDLFHRDEKIRLV